MKIYPLYHPGNSYINSFLHDVFIFVAVSDLDGSTQDP